LLGLSLTPGGFATSPPPLKSGSHFRVGAARHPLAAPDYVGTFDSADCNALVGWAADRSRPNTPINVTVVFDSTLTQTVSASASRADSAAIGAAVGGGDNGLHAFNIPLPTALKNGAPHSIEVRFEASTVGLTSSPRTVTCGPAAFVIPNPKITSFRIQSDSNKTTTDPNLNLVVEFSRAPSFYRMGEVHNLYNPEQDLKNLQWQPYTAGMSFTFHLRTSEPYGTRSVFMQVNSGTSESGASPPEGDSVILAPLHTKTFTLTGPALKTFLDRAKAIGYRFSLSGPTRTGNVPCPNGTIPDPPLAKGTDFFETWTAKLFDKSGPDRELLPFWKVTEINVGDVFKPGDQSDVKVSGPTTGNGDEDPFRSVVFKRGFAVSGGGGGSVFNPPNAFAFACVPANDSSRPDPASLVTSITLVGPDDKTPEDALFPPPSQTLLTSPLLKLPPRFP
jgi:hypothetical protein